MRTNQSCGSRGRSAQQWVRALSHSLTHIMRGEREEFHWYISGASREPPAATGNTSLPKISARLEKEMITAWKPHEKFNKRGREIWLMERWFHLFCRAFSSRSYADHQKVEKSSRQLELATFVVSRVRLKRGAIIIQIVASTTEIDCDLCACFCCCYALPPNKEFVRISRNSSDVKDECVGCHRVAAFRETITKVPADFTWKLKNRFFMAHAMQLWPKRTRERWFHLIWTLNLAQFWERKTILGVLLRSSLHKLDFSKIEWVYKTIDMPVPSSSNWL
jgi:hypothetical protein